MKKAVVGILAHVDAGKTTLAEAILYKTGNLRKLGRVDHGDTLLDTHALERERGITIFASQAVFQTGDLEINLLDTPGHVDFSSETERVLQVLDYAILVISGTDGVQAHTRTLWRLLSIYNIPTFIFVTKMDYSHISREEIMAELKSELSEGCVDFTEENFSSALEEMAMSREDILEEYLETGKIENEKISELIASRQVFPCFFGSGLRLDGIDEFLIALETYIEEKKYPEAFGARVFKITHDGKGNKLTHLKVTGGELKVKDTVIVGENEEKIDQIRVYSGQKFVTKDIALAGEICTVTGLSGTEKGDGLGFEKSSSEPVLEPVMNYRIKLPQDCNPLMMLPKLKQLEEEDPQLHITWNSHLKEIFVELMGEVQVEILKSLVLERFDTEIEIDSGNVLYKETIEGEVEGVGHYEPLRHYAEVHLILEPLPRGSSIQIASRCDENSLDRNWQRLIMTHLTEKTHLGVLTGSPITDMKITLAAGRSHIKHTVGGDFRQATYRAVRQGLMQAKSLLLEPYYAFRIEVPTEQMGRAINDVKMRHGTIENPENSGAFTIIKGRGPVKTMDGYALEIAAYTGGRGKFFCQVDGYDVCHNADEVIVEIGYDPEADLENTPDSVFCSHGSGFPVKWDKVPEYMHIESCLKKKEEVFIPRVNRRNFSIDDKELEAIMEREFGPIKRPMYNYAKNKEKAEAAWTDVKIEEKPRYFIVDGYNVIFAWDDLSSIAQSDLDAARAQLMNTLSNFAGYTKSKIVLVFDAYKVPGNMGKRFDYHNIHVVYTKENETGDMYIEKLIAQIGKNERVNVVTSDGLIQLSATRGGVLRMPAREFEQAVLSTCRDIEKLLGNQEKTRLGDTLNTDSL